MLNKKNKKLISLMKQIFFNLYNLEHLKNLKIKLTKNLTYLSLVNKLVHLVGQAQTNNIQFRFEVNIIIYLIIIYLFLFYYI